MMTATPPKMPNTMPTMDPVELCCTATVEQSHGYMFVDSQFRSMCDMNLCTMQTAKFSNS